LIRLGLIAFAIVLLVAPAIIAWQRSDGDESRRAVIVDQLGETHPNQPLAADIVDLLRGAEYDVIYVPPSQVDVQLYRTLPNRGYDFVLLRTHLATELHERETVEGAPTVTSEPQSSIFTNEPYTQFAHLPDQHARRLYASRTGPEDPLSKFGISADFIASSTAGDFGGAIVLAMGCAGLRTPHLADAFIARGASAFISWDEEVTAEHNDRATKLLIESLTSGRAPADAVADVMAVVGPDPFYDSSLRYYDGAEATRR
jgi:hypothetical protein